MACSGDVGVLLAEQANEPGCRDACVSREGGGSCDQAVEEAVSACEPANAKSLLDVGLTLGLGAGQAATRAGPPTRGMRTGQPRSGSLRGEKVGRVQQQRYIHPGIGLGLDWPCRSPAGAPRRIGRLVARWRARRARPFHLRVGIRVDAEGVARDREGVVQVCVPRSAALGAGWVWKSGTHAGQARSMVEVEATGPLAELPAARGSRVDGI